MWLQDTLPGPTACKVPSELGQDHAAMGKWTENSNAVRIPVRSRAPSQLRQPLRHVHHPIPFSDVDKRASIKGAVDRSSTRRHVLDHVPSPVNQCNQERFEQHFFIARIGRQWIQPLAPTATGSGRSASCLVGLPASSMNFRTPSASPRLPKAQTPRRAVVRATSTSTAARFSNAAAHARVRDAAGCSPVRISATPPCTCMWPNCCLRRRRSSEPVWASLQSRTRAQ